VIGAQIIDKKVFSILSVCNFAGRDVEPLFRGVHKMIPGSRESEIKQCFEVARKNGDFGLNKLDTTELVQYVIPLLTGEKTLAENKALLELHLMENTLNMEGIQMFADALRTNTTLRTLTYYSTKELSPEEVQIIVEALPKTLTSLWIRKVGAAGIKTIAKNLQNTKLSSLKLGTKNMDLEAAQELAAVLPKTTLTSLDLGYSDLGSKNVKFLAAILSKTKLEKLNFSHSDIDPEGAKAFADNLCTNTTLISLNLIANKIGPQGAKVFSDALRTNSTLLSLNLANNNIGPEGAKHLADALCINQTLTSLDLSYNKLGPEGIKIFIEVLTTNTTLTSLELSYNNMDLAGIQALAKVLSTNKTLTTLMLSTIDNEGAKILLEALRTNISLTSMYINKDNIDPEVHREICELLERNKRIASQTFLRESLSNMLPETMLLEILDYSEFSDPARLSRQKLQETAAKHAYESTLNPIDRIIAMIYSELEKMINLDRIAENMKVIMQEANNYIYPDADDAKSAKRIKIGYVLTDADDARVKAAFKSWLPMYLSPKWESDWSRVKDEYILNNIWNSADRLIYVFTHQIKRMLSEVPLWMPQAQEDELKDKITAEIKQTIDTIIAYHREQGYQFCRATDVQDIQKAILNLKNEWVSAFAYEAYYNNVLSKSLLKQCMPLFPHLQKEPTVFHGFQYNIEAELREGKEEKSSKEEKENNEVESLAPLNIHTPQRPGKCVLFRYSQHAKNTIIVVAAIGFGLYLTNR